MAMESRVPVERYVTRAEALRALAEFAGGHSAADLLDEAVSAGRVRRRGQRAAGPLYRMADLAEVRRRLSGTPESSDRDVPPTVY